MIRVVSLVPSVTETLLAWGIQPVAVTRFCEQPDLRAVGGTKNPDVEAIAALAPDLVVMDKEENNLADAEALGARGFDVHVTHVRSVADVAPMLVRLASAVGARRPSPGEPASPDPTDVPTGRRPRVWVPIWRRPWMSINGSTYGSSLLAAVGIDNVAADAPAAYPVTTLEEAAAFRPDAVLAPSEPYSFVERHRPQLETVAPVFFVDGKDLFWWGERTAGAVGRLRDLARRLRPI